MSGILNGERVNFGEMLKDLVELDFDAIEAYKAAIDRLTNDDFKSQLTEFKKQHERHVVEINRILVTHGEETVKGPSGKQWVVKGEVLLGKALGNDKGILKAMAYVEEDTNKAYETINQYKLWDDAVEILQQGLKDEREHKRWLEMTHGDEQ